MVSSLRNRLASAHAVASLLGTDSDGGKPVSWHWFQRGDPLPALALSLVTPGEGWTHDGPDGLDESRIRIDLRAEDPDTLEVLRLAVTEEMHRAVDVDDDWRFHEGERVADRSIDLGEQVGGKVLFAWQLEFMLLHEEISR